MMAQKFSSFISVAMLSLAIAGSANADSIVITAGDIKFTIDNYDASTINYPVFAPPSIHTVCSTVAECDAVPGITRPVGGIGSEDAWGIVSVAGISNISTGQQLFTKGVDGYLIGMFYGVTDSYVEVVCTLSLGCSSTILAVGGAVDLYASASDWTPAGGAIARTSLSTYPGIPTTDLYLSAVFGPGVNGFIPSATYQTTFNQGSFAGDAQGFLDITGGSAAAIFDTNSLFDTVGDPHDLFLSVISNDVNGAARRNGWLLTSEGGVKGYARTIPEPGTLVLLGLGVVAAGWASRRRKMA
jgi:hypothetical protein